MEDEVDTAAIDLQGTVEHPVGGYKWYKDKLWDSPVQALADSMPKLAQILYSLVELKQTHRYTDTGFVGLLVFIVNVILRPPGYTGLNARAPHKAVSIPTTKYMLYRLLGVRPAKSLEWHMCPNGCHVWRPAKALTWRKIRNDHCPVCGYPRFKHQIVTERGRIVRRATRKPARRFWCIGIRRAIR
jgi:hypothetical protein